LLLPVACSSDGDDDSPSSSGGSEAVTVTGAFGEATIESTPERVLALSTTDADFLLSVGVTPIAVPSMPQTDAATNNTSIYPWEEGKYPAGTPKIQAPATDFNVEAVAALDPDLIVATSFWGLDEQNYAALSAIAPVVHFATEANADPWQDNVRKVASAVGREAEADKSIAQAEASIRDAKTANPVLQGKSYNAIISPSADGVYVLCSQEDNLARVMKDLGLTLSDYAQTVECDGGKGEVAWENLPKLNADVLWAIPDTADQMQVLDSQPLWPQLPAVTRGAVATVPKTDGIPFALGFPSPISLEWGVGQLAPEIAGAAAK
jgi:iron complex transport system substrate-binding protein